MVGWIGLTKDLVGPIQMGRCLGLGGSNGIRMWFHVVTGWQGGLTLDI